MQVFLLVPIYISSKIEDNISLQTDYVPQNIKIVKMPPELEVDYILPDELEQKRDQVNKEITEFLKLLHDYFPDVSLQYFYRNISSLQLRIEDIKVDPTLDVKTMGIYDARENRIVVLDEEDSNTMTHELFHMASSYYDHKEKNCFIGFFQSKNGKSIGRAMNEGYTQSLTNRYAKYDSFSYPYETRVAEVIEEVLGQDVLQKNYFAANLKGLIEELKKYKSEPEIMQFLQMFDFYSKYQPQNTILNGKEKKLSVSKQYIERFLYDLRIMKRQTAFNEAISNELTGAEWWLKYEVRFLSYIVEDGFMTEEEFKQDVLNRFGYVISKNEENMIEIEKQSELTENGTMAL